MIETKKSYVLHSGGALGSDSYFDEVGAKYSVKRIHYYHGSKTPLGNTSLTDKELDEGWDNVLQANEILNRFGISKYKSLLGRNWFQVKNSDSIFAIGITKGNQISGGTCWAVTMALLNDKPTFFFDQNVGNWFQVSFNKNRNGLLFNKLDIVKLTNQFAGIGTRSLESNGKQAIEDLFKLTFGT